VPMISDYYAPIHTAANAEVVRALVARGANVEKLTRHRSWSAMHLADKAEIVDALMECGGAGLINQRDAEGKTPLDVLGGANSVNWDVFRRMQHHGAKEGYQLDKQHAEAVAAKKAQSSTTEGQSQRTGRTR
jgi:hypothetical protein